MSHEVNTMMMESITDDVFNSFYDSSVITVELDYLYVGDDGEGLDGSVEAKAVFRGNGYRILPDSLTPIYDEFATANGLAKIDDDFAKMILDDDPEIIQDLEDTANQHLYEDRFMSIYMKKLFDFSQKLSDKTPSSDEILYAIAEDEIEKWAERSGPHGWDFS